jgi:hypothetical protein
MDLRCAVGPDRHQATLLKRLEEAQLGVGEHGAILPADCLDLLAMLLARLRGMANVGSLGRHSARETALRGVIGGGVPGLIRLRFTKRAVALAHLRSTSATLEGRNCQSAQDGFAASTSGVTSDDIGAVVASELPNTRRAGAQQPLALESKCTLIVRIVKRIPLCVHTWRLLIGDEIFNT